MASERAYDGKTFLTWQKLKGVHQTKQGKGVRDEALVVQRAKTFGGWLVRSLGTYEVQRKYDAGDGKKDYEASAGMGVGLTFVPDPNHEWDPREFV